jgi:hypothetical protein
MWKFSVAAVYVSRKNPLQLSAVRWILLLGAFRENEKNLCNQGLCSYYFPTPNAIYSQRRKGKPRR